MILKNFALVQMILKEKYFPYFHPHKGPLAMSRNWLYHNLEKPYSNLGGEASMLPNTL